MRTFIVTDKSTGAEVYRYSADVAIEWHGMAFATHDHTPLPEVPEQPAPAVAKVWDRIEYLRLLTAEERIAIREAARTDLVVEDIVDLQRNAGVIRSDDPDLIRALTYLTAVGILAGGRLQEILNG